ncbi:hypothetical protein OCU04_001704 [Sclerotinia nivalis]|uniref:Uncharacterized protein n=1 Tax=Sclerotinia nivalis TaxID=352851 RepID=A0A9X0AYZ7_9HELO|nr:hypothetical protein OCU04_001704 [Sclerotinia nivalis]
MLQAFGIFIAILPSLILLFIIIWGRIYNYNRFANEESFDIEANDSNSNSNSNFNYNSSPGSSSDSEKLR